MKLVFIFCCLLASAAQATEYFVSQDYGSKENNGKSWEGAFQNIQQAVDQSNPGDLITIRKSVKHYPPVTINKSGAEGYPIVLQGELAESPPTITGGYLIIDWREGDDGDIWVTKTTASPNLVIEDNKNLVKAKSSELNDGKWFWQDGYLYYKPSSGTPFNHNVWRSARAGGVKLKNSSWIVLKNLKLKLGQGAGIELKNSHYNTIENVTVKWHWQGVRIANGSTYNQVLNAVVEENREGIYIAINSSYNLIKDCKAFWNGNLPYWNKGDRGGVLIGESGVNSNNTIDGCEVAFNGGPNSDPAVIAYKAPKTILINNNIYDNYASGLFVTIWSNDSRVINNIVQNNGKKAVLSGYKGISGLSIRRTKRVLVQGNKVLNNYVSPNSRWTGKDIGPKGGLDLQGNSNDTLENISFIQNTVSGTKGGPNFFISKIPKTPGLIVK